MARIAICAPSTPFTRMDADRVLALAAAEFPQHQLVFHDQCFAVDGHFAGPDSLRLSALLECSSDPAFDAVWFVRGGYGANRIAAEAVAAMGSAAIRFAPYPPRTNHTASKAGSLEHSSSADSRSESGPAKWPSTAKH